MQGSVEPLGLLVAAIRRSVKGMVARRVAPLGLAPLQFWLLVGTMETPASSQAELARRLRLDEPSVSRAVARLSRKGWLRAQRDRADRRRVLLALTPAGRALAGSLLPIAAEVRAAVEAPLAPDERERVRGALVRIAGYLRDRGQDEAGRADRVVARVGRRRAGGTR
jgi:DNA-binding MarR family transcriptional regulator